MNGAEVATIRPDGGGITVGWTHDLFHELSTGVKRELMMTVKVAVCKTAKMPKAQMLDQLGITDVEARMCELRIGSVVGGW